jgi:protein gp37
MQKTSIDYLTHTWNPLSMRCTPVSEGCEHCWHLRMADRLAANPNIGNAEAESYAGHDTPLVRWKELKKPITAKTPGIIGVQFMGDLFHLGVDFGMVHEVFDVMWQSPHHTFLVLTKRPERMFEFMTQKNIQNMYSNEWPLKNVWLGVSCENQARANERIPILLEIPAAVRWVSIEPMIGPVDLTNLSIHSPEDENDPAISLDALTGRVKGPDEMMDSRLGWVVLGGETGPGARPMEGDWARSVREQCTASGVPFYFKQHGDAWRKMFSRPGYRENYELDGREWREMPEAVR